MAVTKPTVGGSTDTWGTELNAALDNLDSRVTSAAGVATSASTTAATATTAASAASTAATAAQATANTASTNASTALTAANSASGRVSPYYHVTRYTVADASLDMSVTSVTADVVVYTALTATRDVKLPSAISNSGRVLTIKDETGNAGAHAITIHLGVGGQTIDGQANTSFNTNYGFLRFYSNGANWFSF